MSLITKSILAPIEKEDGWRISVMSRHTLEDGVTPDERIGQERYNEHMIDLAPSPKLIGDYYKRGLSWEDYKKRYLTELNDPSKTKLVKKLASRALKENITILCIEEKPDFCHRRLLAEECKKYEPELGVILK